MKNLISRCTFLLAFFFSFTAHALSPLSNFLIESIRKIDAQNTEITISYDYYGKPGRQFESLVDDDGGLLLRLIDHAVLTEMMGKMDEEARNSNFDSDAEWDEFHAKVDTRPVANWSQFRDTTLKTLQKMKTSIQGFMEASAKYKEIYGAPLAFIGEMEAALAQVEAPTYGFWHQWVTSYFIRFPKAHAYGGDNLHDLNNAFGELLSEVNLENWKEHRSKSGFHQFNAPAAEVFNSCKVILAE